MIKFTVQKKHISTEICQQFSFYIINYAMYFLSNYDVTDHAKLLDVLMSLPESHAALLRAARFVNLLLDNHDYMKYNHTNVYMEAPSNEKRVTVKPVYNDLSKVDKTKILMTNCSLMKVQCIAECSPWSILQFF